MHLDTFSLIAYLDGELEEHLRNKIATHLDICATCRAEADSIEYDRDWLVVLDAASHSQEPPSVQDGVERLRAAMYDWCEQHPETIVARRPAGAETAADDACEYDPLVAAFLGRRAPGLLG